MEEAPCLVRIAGRTHAVSRNAPCGGLGKWPAGSGCAHRIAAKQAVSGGLLPRHHGLGERASGRWVKVAVLDMDGTLVPGALGLDLAQWLLASGVRVEMGRLLDAQRAYRSGQTSYGAMSVTAHQVFAREMAGLRVGCVEKMAARVWLLARTRLFCFVRPLIAGLRRSGHQIVLISGSPQEVVGLAAADLGLDRWAAAALATCGGRYRARLLRAPGLKGGKLHAMRELLADACVDLRSSVAIGNSPGDVEVLDIVGYPFAFEPEPALAVIARERGWPAIDRGDALAVIAAELSWEAK
jgi:phosphoserine phosphatase